MSADHARRGLDLPGLGDDREVFLGLEQKAQAGADDRVIVCDYESNRVHATNRNRGTANEDNWWANEQQAIMRKAADRLELERMAGEAEAFIGALERDLIDAGEFA